MPQHQKDELFLVGAVHQAALAARDLYLWLGEGIREARELLIERLSAPAVDDDDAADALVHGHLIDLRQREQPGLQNVGLLHAHGRLHGAQTYPAAALMKDLESHVRPSPCPR